MTYRTGKVVTNVIVGVFGLVLIAFTAAFAILLLQAFSLVDTSIGLNTSFTGYEYISIEATFVALMVSAGYYVIRNALTHPTISIEVDEE